MKKINYNNINKHIAMIFKDYRLKNNYTQEQVAELSDLSSKYISQLERGISGGTLETILKLCNVYDVSPDTILEPFLPNKLKNQDTIFIDKYNKLSKKNKEAIDLLMNHFLKAKQKIFKIFLSLFLLLQLSLIH